MAVFRLLEGSFSFADCGKAKMSGTKKLECQLTLRAGQIVYDPNGLSMPEWEHAPAGVLGTAAVSSDTSTALRATLQKR